MASESNEVSESTKGAVMSAFYWGYGLSQVPGGVAAQRYGGDTVLTLCFLSWSLASLMTPGDARRTVSLILWRFIVGVSQGFLIPAVHTVVSVWMRREERAKAVSLITSGMYLGSASAMWLLPMVSRLFGGKAILRLVGVMGLCWVGLFRAVRRLFRADSGLGNVMERGMSGGVPGQGVPGQKCDSMDNDGLPVLSTESSTRKKTPMEFLKHPSVLAVVVNNFTFHYAFYIVMNWLPTYFDTVLHAPLQSVGITKTLPYLTMFLTSNAGAWVGEYVIQTRGASVAAGRKLVNTCGFVATACMLCLMPAATDVRFGLFATTMALGAAGFARGGFSVNHMDIAPSHAGVIMGISNTAGTLSGVIGVAVTGYILSSWGPDSKGGWYVSFTLAAALCVVGAMVFLRHAQGRRVFT
jgi:ACS family sodium-dependent inorganic phosphate cotransporter